MQVRRASIVAGMACVFAGVATRTAWSPGQLGAERACCFPAHTLLEPFAVAASVLELPLGILYHSFALIHVEVFPFDLGARIPETSHVERSLATKRRYRNIQQTLVTS